MSPLSRGIFIIVSGAAEWVWCFILSGILCTNTTALHDVSSPPPRHLYRAPGEGERGEEERRGDFKLTCLSATDTSGWLMVDGML